MKNKSSRKAIKDRFRVAIFGSARIKKDDARYKLIYTLAKRIAAEGIDIVTGGGPGLMDAASRGHHAGRKKKDISRSQCVSDYFKKKNLIPRLELV